MGKECVVVGCSNRDTDKQPGLKFHRIPKTEPRRSKRLKAINRKDPVTGENWMPGDDGARICSEHFIQGKNDHPDSPDYVPSVNLGYNTPVATLSRFNRAVRRSTGKGKRQLDFQTRVDDQDLAARMLVELSNSPVLTSSANKENVAEPSGVEKCVQLIDQLTVEKKQLEKEVASLLLHNQHLTETCFKLRSRHLKTDDEIKFYTGLPSRQVFEWLVDFVCDVLPTSSILCPADIVLLVFMKLRLNVPH